MAPAVGTPLTRQHGGFWVAALVGTVSVTHQRQVPAVFAELVDGASLQFFDKVVDILFFTETGRRHPCHGAVAGSLGVLAIEITQLQFIDQVFDVLVAQV